MGFEPAAVADARLRLVLTTTSDATLRSTLSELIRGSFVHSKFDETAAVRPSASPAPSPAARGDRLVHDTLSVPTGDAPADRSNGTPALRADGDDDQLLCGLQFGADVRPLLADALSTGDTAGELLAAASTQARALAAVWEAHRRGVIALPEPLADAVSRARGCWPAALRPMIATPASRKAGP
jgi:hypothetical protein